MAQKYSKLDKKHLIDCYLSGESVISTTKQNGISKTRFILGLENMWLNKMYQENQ